MNAVDYLGANRSLRPLCRTHSDAVRYSVVEVDVHFVPVCALRGTLHLADSPFISTMAAIFAAIAVVAILAAACRGYLSSCKPGVERCSF